MRQIEKIVAKIEGCIKNGTFQKLEHDKFELKDNSHTAAEWREVCKTACAFLNTNGGILIIGIHEDEKNKKFAVTGFDKRNEDKIKEITKVFTNEKKHPLNLSEYFTSFEFHEVSDKEILALYIEELPEELKYVYYEGKPYERLLTGDHRIPDIKVLAQNEYKQEIQHAKELQPVINTALSDLDINRLNEYIQLLNKDVRTESIKPDIEQALSFLLRKGFITQSHQPTILGILVCGNNIEDLLGSRCQVDGYVDTGLDAGRVAENKKILKDNILPLMERGINFIFQNIKVGVIIESGGSSVPEYPVRLIRESVNNSLAHRDYGINRFITINIVPGKHIEIRNPGRFKAQLLLQDINHPVPVRRIIPGNPKPNNPKLAEVLKVFDKWEGKGLGMSTLTNECLANNIDLPFYKFHSEDELSLLIPKGNLLDERMQALFKTYAGYIERKLNGKEITLEQKLVLSYFYKSELENKNDRYTILLTKDNNHFAVINSLEDSGLIIKHPVSNELYPVYIIDRELFKKEFITELRKMFGAAYDDLNKEAKEILSLIYEFNKYSKDKYPGANIIGNILWTKAGKAATIEGFEAFKRKVRNLVNQLSKSGIILRVKDKPLYQLNTKFKRQPSIYDDVN
jgi:predicted HTH transcriptional regulator